MTRPSTRIVIVGAGMVGMCAAVALAERGCGVTLVERHLPGAANSTLTGGGIRQQFGSPTNLALSLLAQPWWDTFAARFGVDPLLREIGYLFLARTAREADALRASIALQRDHGVDSLSLDGDTLARRWSALGGRGFIAGAFRQQDGWANQQRIVDGLYRGLLARQVELRVGTECLALIAAGGRVSGVHTTDVAIEGDAVLLASGSWGLDLLAAAGHLLPVTARRHELLIVETGRPLPPGLPWLIGTDDQVHLRPDAPGRALVGGFLGHDDAVDPDAYATRADPDWTRAVLGTAARAFGVIDADARVCRGWAGLYPSTPDRHPIIDRLGDGLYVAMGFSGTGLMHAPAAGILAAQLVVDGAIEHAFADALRANRFAAAGRAPELTGF